jgi:hypothetical protein
MGIGGDKDGMYVFSAKLNRTFLRKFGHDLKYIASLTPPPADLPESKLEGMGYIEYEPGKRAVHSPDNSTTTCRNGLILHVGRYGTFDSADGPKSRIPVGGDNIAMSVARFVSTTDNYMVFDDNGERVTVVRLNYHAEETVGIVGE